MNKSTVIDQLKSKYPKTNIVCIPDNQPTEILCEVDPTSKHSQFSRAIAVIDKSAPHYHKRITETYTVKEGTLELTVDDKKFNLKPGEKFIIKPGQTHFAVGRQAWVECFSEPGWTPEDHILI